jgi:hypothetical protein
VQGCAQAGFQDDNGSMQQPKKTPAKLGYAATYTDLLGSMDRNGRERPPDDPCASPRKPEGETAGCPETSA